MLMMDTMETQAVLSLQSSLRSVSSLLALFNQPSLSGQYGLCAAVHTGKGVMLQAGCCAVLCCRNSRAAVFTSMYSYRCCCGLSPLTYASGTLRWTS